ncbi:MAG: NADP-dependent isocitrate dehydrogenase [Caldiserica bacterium]|nr:MAG: NADP-dependent isocitrate dehydrogenase [Caldisericota bacterium]
MKITVENGKMYVPNNPTIPYIIGDGIGRDITPVALKVFDVAVEKVYNGQRKIEWLKIIAGEEALEKKGEPLPKETIETIKEYIVAIKGPLTTPVGGGYRSLNVTMRQTLDLFVCFRPVRYFNGMPSPMKHPELLDVIIFRENTEDVYAGIEWPYDSKESIEIKNFLKDKLNVNIKENSGIGIKPISISGSKRIGKAAIDYALKYGRKSITIMHKGNIMKYTEGLFKNAIYQFAEEKFKDTVITEKELTEKYNGKIPDGKIVLKDRIADALFQQLLLRPSEYDIIVAPNLNGDYISDACAAQVGGLGMAPGGNINFNTHVALFEATHGSAPKHAGKNEINPGSIILSGAEMFEYMGWDKVKKVIIAAIEKTIQEKYVTYDLARQIDGATKVSTSDFGNRIIKNMEEI